MPGAETDDGDEAAFIRLAKLGAVEYDRVRKTEAERLGIRTTTLDAEVARRRPKPISADADVGQGLSVTFETDEPAEEPASGLDVFNEIVSVIEKYIALPEGAVGILALWAMHTHCLDLFDYSPLLRFVSSVPESGKSHAADATRALCRRPKRVDSASTSYVFRIVARDRPTLGLDEVDKMDEDLRRDTAAILNSGYERAGCIGRCVGDDLDPRDFPTFGPKIVSGLCELRADTASRTLRVRMDRAGRQLPEFSYAKFRVETADLRRRMLRLLEDHRQAIREADLQRPDWLFGRLWDVTKPLAAIAHAIDPTLPGQFYQWVGLLRQERVEQAVGIELLSDIRDAFTARAEAVAKGSLEDPDRMTTDELLAFLHDLDGRRWGDWHDGRPMSAKAFARQLGKFSATPPRRLRPDHAAQHPHERQSAQGLPPGELRTRLERLSSLSLRATPPKFAATRHNH